MQRRYHHRLSNSPAPPLAQAVAKYLPCLWLQSLRWSHRHTAHIRSVRERYYKDSAKTAHTYDRTVGDGTSEEYILESGPDDGKAVGDIVRTTDYHVAYDRNRKMPSDPYLPDERTYPEYKQW